MNEIKPLREIVGAFSLVFYIQNHLVNIYPFLVR